jgi:hypothetical protein
MVTYPLTAGFKSPMHAFFKTNNYLSWTTEYIRAGQETAKRSK